ncbi:hypothetical protein M011DRAFT_200296 [Sporormia fimetaria CBS 119925]|uniref:Uncharacterized protein n=1 Tax=Sporormia fimetaria CBS 119925 TaxID=1340428 RepID=A0A6A6V219_9PLEO|nr:hypothetical protein M011DRAFT_200296 [Sporormia fimetaria CBS 119925]
MGCSRAGGVGVECGVDGGQGAEDCWGDGRWTIDSVARVAEGVRSHARTLGRAGCRRWRRDTVSFRLCATWCAALRDAGPRQRQPSQDRQRRFVFHRTLREGICPHSGTHQRRTRHSGTCKDGAAGHLQRLPTIYCPSAGEQRIYLAVQYLQRYRLLNETFADPRRHSAGVVR